MINIFLIFFSLSLNAQEFRNVAFIKNTSNEEENFKILNAFSNSASYAFWMNRNLNYNGTSSLGSKKKSEDLPYQFLRMLSLFDHYLTHSSLEFSPKESQRIHSVFLSTILEEKDIGDFPPFSNDYIKNYYPIVRAIIPFAQRLEFKSFNPNDVFYTEKGTSFSNEFSQKMRTKVKDKLDLIWTRIKFYSDTGQIPIDAFNDSLMPVNFLGEIHLDSKKNNFYQIDILLPGLADIKKENRRGMLTQNPLEWQLEPGISKDFFPPLVGLADKLEKMSYLKDAQEGTQWEEIKNKLIHIQIYKNLNDLDKMELTMEFGEVPEPNFVEKKEENNRLTLFPIDISNRRSALKIDGYINLPKGKILNKFMNDFKIEAFIHRLSFDLIRKEKFKNWQERFDKNSTFIMKSKPEKTFLSLRLKKGTNSLREAWMLRKAGLTCGHYRELYKQYKVPPIPNNEYLCFADFSNVEEFMSEFIPKHAKTLTRKGIGAFATLELNTFLKNLDQMNKLDLAKEKNLLERIFTVFKDNQILFESINFLPKEMKEFITK